MSNYEELLMSNYWDVHCKDCGESAGCRVNRGGEVLRAILANAECLIGILDSLLNLEDVEIDLDLTHYQVDNLVDLIGFVGHHKDHNLVALDEYGKGDNR